MNKITTILLLAFCIAMTSCQRKYQDIPEQYHVMLDTAFQKAGNNAVELRKVLEGTPKEEKEGMAFLIAYMPQLDLDSISAQLLVDNCTYAYKAKEEFVWAKSLPDSIFFNDVLPYANLNERRDNWRGDFYNRFSKYVKNCDNIFDAIDAVNKHIAAEVKVEYNTARKKADQSPYESMEINMASCSGLSILLADAFRSVGIPARIAGTPLWYDSSGNHNWVEVWVNGTWQFTEYYSEGLDKGWVVEKAGKCNPNKRDNAIYAASFKPTGLAFPLVWDTLNTLGWVHGKNVSDRYIALYEKFKAGKHLKDNEILVRVWLLKDKNIGLNSGNRISRQVNIYYRDSIVESGYTADARKDMNNYLFFILNKDKHYTAKYTDALGNNKAIKFIPKDTLMLY